MLTFLTKATSSLLLILAIASISSLACAQSNDTSANAEQPEISLQAKPSHEDASVAAAKQQALVAADIPNNKALVTTLAEKPSQRASSGLSLSKMAISLAIVVLIVLVLGWLFKKLTLRLPGGKHIKIISTTSLGPKEKLLVIEMQGKQRVLGVTANSINLLFELENPLPEEKLASDFHTQLQSFLKK